LEDSTDKGESRTNEPTSVRPADKGRWRCGLSRGIEEDISNSRHEYRDVGTDEAAGRNGQEKRVTLRQEFA
jgi:hypothetical protein